MDELSFTRDGLSEIISRHVSSSQDFKSTQKLKAVLVKILRTEVAESLAEFWLRPQHIKVRLEALIKLALSMLCVPKLSSFLGEGVSSSDVNDDLFALRAHVTKIFYLITNAERCIFQLGSDESLDDFRIQLLISLLSYRQSPVIPFYVTISEYAPEAISCLTCHILSVGVLSDDVVDAINTVVTQLKDYIHTATQDEIKDSIETSLKRYFAWIRDHHAVLSKQCHNQELLHYIDRTDEAVGAANGPLRSNLYAETYTSPHHLLEVYRLKYQARLCSMPMPLLVLDIADIDQAKKDMVRETFLIDSVLTAGTDASSKLMSTISSALYQFHDQNATQDLRMASRRSRSRSDNSTVPTSVSSSTLSLCQPGGGGTGGTSSSVKGKVQLVRPTSAASYSTPPPPPGTPLSSSPIPTSTLVMKMDFSSATSPMTTNTTTTTAVGAESVSSSKSKILSPTSSLPSSPRLQYVSLLESQLKEQLHRYLLLASSRTLAVGDALHILDHLYGGEGLVLQSVPKAQTQSIIQTSVTAAGGLQTVMQATFHLYIREVLEQDMASAQPLIGINVSITSVFSIKQFMRVKDDSMTVWTLKDSISRLFKALFLSPEKVCSRSLSIEPFEVIPGRNKRREP